MDTRCPLYFKPADLMAVFSRGMEGAPDLSSTRPVCGLDSDRTDARFRWSHALHRSLAALSAGAARRHAGYRAAFTARRAPANAAPYLPVEDGARVTFDRPAGVAHGGLSSRYLFSTAARD